MANDEPPKSDKPEETLQVWWTDDGAVLNTNTNAGVIRTFARRDRGTLTLEDQDFVSKFERVGGFLSELQQTNVPLMINTKSGAGEELFLGLNVREADLVEQFHPLAGGEVKSVWTVNCYARGNGINAPKDTFTLVGHRDWGECEDESGNRYVFTDLKAKDGDYLPPQDAKWDIDVPSFMRFADSTKAIERYKDGEHDDYNVGVGRLMQGVMTGLVLNRGITKLNTGIMLEDGSRTWKKFGYDSETQTIDREKALEVITKDIYEHVR
jgi:hypothetical protein